MNFPGKFRENSENKRRFLVVFQVSVSERKRSQNFLWNFPRIYIEMYENFHGIFTLYFLVTARISGNFKISPSIEYTPVHHEYSTKPHGKFPESSPSTTTKILFQGILVLGWPSIIDPFNTDSKSFASTTVRFFHENSWKNLKYFCTNLVSFSKNYWDLKFSRIFWENSSPLCLKTLIVAPESRDPHTIEAWFRVSLIIKFPGNFNINIEFSPKIRGNFSTSSAGKSWQYSRISGVTHANH